MYGVHKGHISDFYYFCSEWLRKTVLFHVQDRRDRWKFAEIHDASDQREGKEYFWRWVNAKNTELSEATTSN